ncbi:hypothetical protein HOP50_13g71030 [Chloropicon primus]|uniref:Ribosomal protein L46 N-terminal domain-containing protein n=2 Tax=Chloropicon primus TaxID=1764295 RepID=A0A5B8MY39_9CHLO|nr:hypothetical protein A3770_13p70830 [Chloropicon primus]UPR03773.1 hypothetical protein HOP50_13g71030 [Chloropicon primus]|eukprot:QDZ24565.1 hypothetical protein A3770_13p70830 [Chloropicon primus]
MRCRSGAARVLTWRILDRLQAKKVDPLALLHQQTEGLAGTHGGILFTRMPLCLPPKPKWESEYLEWQEEWHKRSGRHRQWPEWLEQGDLGGSEQRQGSGGEGGGQGVEQGGGEGKQAAPLEQEADRVNDRRTVQRRIDSHLYLLLKSKETERWFFPHVPHAARETLRQTCERALETFVDHGKVETFFIGNGPCGMLPVEDEGNGNVFLIPVELIKGSPRLNKKVADSVSDFAWVAKDEMPEYFESQETRDYLDKLLQDKSDYYGSGTSQAH